MELVYQSVGVVGAGVMGQGIAQIAAQAGSQVKLLNSHASSTASAHAAIVARWDHKVSKGRLSAELAATYQSCLSCADELSNLADCDLVIEAIAEDFDAKASLLKQLQTLVRADTVLATNTSSLSVTALAAQLSQPERLAGYHFFNPVPVMKIVEVVAALQTHPAICQQLATYAQQLGHTAVHAQDTPGFIVNHASRGYSTEALRIASENVADFATIDRILREQAGFKLGPFELMDLTGLDITQPVMEGIYQAYYQEPRYRPSTISAQRLRAGLLGQKTHQGFYTYTNGSAQIPPEPAVPNDIDIPSVWVSPRAARRQELLSLLKQLGARIETGVAASDQALIVVAPLGLDVTTVAVVDKLDPTRTIGIDLLLSDAQVRRRVLAINPATRSDMRQAAHALFARDGKAVSIIRDSGGFVTQRVIACLVNVASDMCQQGICKPQDLETAVTLALGYPSGPLSMGDHCGPGNILEVLFNLQTVYGDPRYRPSPWLRRRGAMGLSLLHEESW